jgi:hypothetical protein
VAKQRDFGKPRCSASPRNIRLLRGLPYAHYVRPSSVCGSSKRTFPKIAPALSAFNGKLKPERLCVLRDGPLVLQQTSLGRYAKPICLLPLIETKGLHAWICSTGNVSGTHPFDLSCNTSIGDSTSGPLHLWHHMKWACGRFSGRTTPRFLRTWKTCSGAWRKQRSRSTKEKAPHLAARGFLRGSTSD